MNDNTKAAKFQVESPCVFHGISFRPVFPVCFSFSLSILIHSYWKKNAFHRPQAFSGAAGSFAAVFRADSSS